MFEHRSMQGAINSRELKGIIRDPAFNRRRILGKTIAENNRN